MVLHVFVQHLAVALVNTLVGLVGSLRLLLLLLSQVNKSVRLPSKITVPHVLLRNDSGITRPCNTFFAYAESLTIWISVYGYRVVVAT
jgi:hypothetical protein